MRRLAFLPALSLALAAAQPVPIQAPIQKVRLHPSEAWVTRVGKATVPASGTHRLVIGGLPPSLKLDDLQVSARGPAGSHLGDVRLGFDTEPSAEGTTWTKLEAEHKTLQDRRDHLESQMEALRQEEAFLKGMLATQSKELGERMTYTLPSAGPVVELARGIQERLSTLLLKEHQLKHDLEALAKQESQFNARQSNFQRAQQRYPTQLTAELTTPSAGPVELEVSYRQTAARWAPLYEARLSEDRTRLQVSLYAAITQSSGESWEGVHLEISNAKPSRSLETPAFQGPEELSWTVPEEEPRYAVAGGVPGGVAGGVVGGVVGGMAKMEDRSLEALAPPPPPPPPPALEAMAALASEASGMSRTFLLEGAKEIPSDGQPHRFKLMARELGAQMKVVVLPRLNAQAFQVADFSAPEDLPLFPGAPVVQYAGSQRLGQAPLSLPATGKPFRLGFGPMEGVRVDLRTLDHKLETIGTFTKQRQWTRRESLQVSNDTPHPLEVEIQDRKLTSTTEALKITYLPETTAGAVEPQPGVFAWAVTIPSGKTTTILESMQARAPEKGEVTGVEALE